MLNLMTKRAWVCCLHDFRRLLTTPRAWAVLILTYLLLDGELAPVQLMLVSEKMKVSWMGMMMFLLNDPQVTMLIGMLLLMLLFDVPMTDETQRYIITRTGRGAWAMGHVYYIFLSTLVYLGLVSLIVLVQLAPYLDWTGGWGSGLIAFAEGGAYEVYDSMLNYDPWLVRVYSATGGGMLAMGLHYLAYSAVALFMCGTNVAFATRLGFLAGAVPIMLDSVADEYFSSNVLYYLPITLSRPSALDYGDLMGRPSLAYAWIVLGGLCLVLAIAVVELCRKREIDL